MLILLYSTRRHWYNIRNLNIIITKLSAHPVPKFLKQCIMNKPGLQVNRNTGAKNPLPPPNHTTSTLPRPPCVSTIPAESHDSGPGLVPTGALGDAVCYLVYPL